MRAGIVGGGITGLATAYYLGKSGIEATVFDPTPGGTIGTVHLEGCVLETGPESWLAAKPWAEQLIRELGMGDQLAESNDAQRKTYVLRDGRFVTLPEGLQMVVPTKIMPIVSTDLFSWGTKIRMGLEIFRSPKAMPDRSISDFVRDHFNQEAVDYLAEPLLAGVYGGSPDELSAASVLPKFVEYEQRYGSVVVGAMRQKHKPSGKGIFRSLRNGLGSLIDALSAKVNIIQTSVEALKPSWGLRADGAWYNFDRVVLACGAHRSVPLLASIDERLSELLGQIPYSGSSIWTFGYRRDQIQHPLDAFGFLVPRPERKAIMACTWLQTKWLGRVPGDKAVFRCFSGDPSIGREEVEADLKRLMGITVDPIFALNHRWPETMPQYTVGHAARLEEMEARAKQIAGLYMAGNSFNGIGIPDCIRSAQKAAEAIVAAG